MKLNKLELIKINMVNINNNNDINLQGLDLNEVIYVGRGLRVILETYIVRT